MFKVENMSLHYGEKMALDNINIEIKEKEVTAFIGPSGCGKSSFLRSLNRMNDLIEEAKIEGIVKLKGENIYDKKYDVIDLRTKVGMVFQSPNPFPMSIFENVVYGPKRQGVRNKKTLREIAEKALKQAALWEEVSSRLNESAMKLSGGQQQRLCIARTLAMEPEVILMDEPTSALDPIATQKIEDLIRELKNDYTIIIVTHNMQQAARISDKTAFFYMGELIEFDKTTKIFNKPKYDQTEKYITGRFG
ncbi:MAG: phosphate ABC transporter ATP-binding protein PstB [Acholeplasmataceae bacterium]|nr:phosphate ABC transporter ATP-binding protein PstB [Acholeplasmataceae bacterium]